MWLESSQKNKGGEGYDMKLGGTRQCKAFTVIKILVFWSKVMKPLQDFKQQNDCDPIYIIQKSRKRPEARRPVREYCHKLWHLGFDCLGIYSVQPAPLWFSNPGPQPWTCSPWLGELWIFNYSGVLWELQHHCVMPSLKRKGQPRKEIQATTCHI